MAQLNYTTNALFVTFLILKAFYLTVELAFKMCDNNTERIYVNIEMEGFYFGKSRFKNCPTSKDGRHR